MKINTIGIMTGNSLDAVDVVLSNFDDKLIKDISSHTLPYPQELKASLLLLRETIKEYKSLMEEVEKLPIFGETVEQYTRLVAKAVNELMQKSSLKKDEVAAIGFHGQTCDHFPPSVAKGKPSYTLQVGDAELLADLTDIPVIYDFRSDDIINGGEGAPLAPVHNLHIAQALSVESVAFCNAGNTGNIAIIEQKSAVLSRVLGWDIGPFNHLPDSLMRKYQSLDYDKNGEFASKGKVCPALLSKMFKQVAVNSVGDNFYMQQPPKSSDPSWYNVVYDEDYCFEDNLRTAEYLSVYTYVYSLSYIPEDFVMPKMFLLFGGGWKNPLVKEDFIALLNKKGLILPEDMEIFSSIWARLGNDIIVEWADVYGFSGEYMEARVFADMAYCRIIKQPFSFPSTTNCCKPTIGGIFVLPQTGKKYAVSEMIDGKAETSPCKWSRASKGWQLSTY